MLSACASMGVPGFGDAGGCRTVYVFTGGKVQPVNSCGAVPRETMMAQKAMISSAPLELEPVDPDAAPATDADAGPGPEVTPVSAAAAATAPHELPAPYANPNAMIENADMAAFMGRVRSGFAHSSNVGAWGYMVVDALAADDPATAQMVIDGLTGKPPTEWMGANHLRPWVYAANGRTADAVTEMEKLRNALPQSTLRRHRALLAEGMGDYDAALAIYAESPDRYDMPKPSEAGSMDYYPRYMIFREQRVMALREAELLRGLNRDEDAVALLKLLFAAVPDDPYVAERLARATKGEDRWAPRTLKQAMALALGDEASLIEEQEDNVVAMTGRGARAPFNHLLSSMRQSALLLDPDNGDIRIMEAGKLYGQGKFEPALRIAQIGNPRKEQAALLQSTAALAALQLGSPDTLAALVERSLKIDNSIDAKLQAASTLIPANENARAMQLVDQVMKARDLSPAQRVYALMTRAQAHSQAGNFEAAIVDARAAYALGGDEATHQFLASALADVAATREEGLNIMRAMLAKSPDDTGLMNNLGYSLIEGHGAPAELDEGFRMLKQAIRMTPDEANLLDSIGWAYYQYGDFREANRFIQMALDSYEPFAHWELSDHMGDVQWRLGDEEAARRHWAASLRAYPPAANAAVLEAKLKAGLTTPAPVKRDTPEVPLNKPVDPATEI